MSEPYTEIEVQSCDLDFFLRDQNSDHAWIKRGSWKLLNVETVSGDGGWGTRKVAWLTRTVTKTPATVEVVEDA